MGNLNHHIPKSLHAVLAPQKEKLINLKPSSVIPLNEFETTQSIDISPWKSENDKWTQKLDLKETPTIGEEIIIMTYNVWFVNFHFKERRDELFKIFKETSPHILCLQEVIPEFIQELVNQDWAKSYYISDANGQFVEPYGICILSKFPIKYSVWALPTQMGRNCVIGTIRFKNGHTLCCATVHLESLNLSNYREKQLEVISEILKKSDTAVLMGDFNFDAEINFSQHLKKCQIATEQKKNPSEIPDPPLEGEPLENEVIRKYFVGYEDVWCQLRPTDPGYTFDSVKNTMLQNYEQMRYDRILLKSNYLKPVEIKLVGTERIKNLEELVFPSDHFGIELRLRKF